MELSGHVNNLSGDAAVTFLREQEAIRRARSKRRWITVGIVLAVAFLGLVGCSAIVVSAASAGAHAAATAPAAPPAASTAPRPAAGSAAPTAPALSSAEPSAAPSLPAGTYGPGTYRLGNDIAPGDYVTDGPSGPNGFATWSRLSDTSGDYTAVIATGIVEGHTVITVSANDAAVHFTGPATWRVA